MKEERKREINEMAKAVDDKLGPSHPLHSSKRYDDFDLVKKTITGAEAAKIGAAYHTSLAEKIIATKKLEIPKTELLPTNGRIYVVSVAGNDMKTPGGLILPPTFAMQKNDQVEGVQRYFVVAWDTEEIPESIKSKLSVGIEVNPFLPWEAQDWKLPRVVDWETGNIFDVIHYTELAGISKNKPVEVK
jgi:hypothetical protein